MMLAPKLMRRVNVPLFLWLGVWRRMLFGCEDESAKPKADEGVAVTGRIRGLILFPVNVL